MQNIPSIISKQSYNRGGRISSSKHRETYELCDGFMGLEGDANRYDLLLLVKKTGKLSGFSPRMIALLDYYMAFTRDIDWEEGARPIIYQSLAKTSLDLGVSERQIQKLENQLFEAGALTWNDSGNHRRYGHRDPETGMILYAYGVDLTPLAYLRPALEKKLQEKEVSDRAWLETKRQISWHRRQIQAILAELSQEQSRGGVEIKILQGTYKTIAIPIRTYMDLNSLNRLLAEHKRLYQEVLERVTHKNQKISQKCSSKDEKKIVNYKSTTYQKSDKSDYSSSNDQSFQKSVVTYSEQKTHVCEKTNSEIGIQHITLKQVLNAASERFRDHIPLEPRSMTWTDVVEAAYKLKNTLFISQKSWAEACVILGRTGAAICILLTDQAMSREKDPVRKPAAYFNAMINRAKKGELQLQQSIFGILKREEENA